jgi:hypothetical protein
LIYKIVRNIKNNQKSVKDLKNVKDLKYGMVGHVAASWGCFCDCLA